jgi:hypothetical protein
VLQSPRLAAEGGEMKFDNDSSFNPFDELITTCAGDLKGKRVPERKFLVDGAIPHIYVTNISGDGGLGKTILALMLGTSLSSHPGSASMRCKVPSYTLGPKTMTTRSTSASTKCV